MPFDGLESPFNNLAKLDRLIGLVETPGRWTKCAYTKPGGQVCLKEALNIVGGAEVFEPAILRVAGEIAEREFCCIESFNDWPQTTQGDVVFVLWQVRDEIAGGRFKPPAQASSYPGPAQPNGRGGTPGAGFAGFWRTLFG